MPRTENRRPTAGVRAAATQPLRRRAARLSGAAGLAVLGAAVLVNGAGTGPAGATTPDAVAFVAENGPSGVDAFATTTNSWIGSPIATNTSDFPVGVAISPDATTAYVTDGSFSPGGMLTYIATDSDTETANVALPHDPTGPIAVTPDGSTAYVLGLESLMPVDLSTQTAGAAITTNAADADLGLAITPSGTTAYIPTSIMGPCTSLSTCYDEVLPVNLATATVDPSIDVPNYVGTWPDGFQEELSGGVAVTPSGATVYVVLNAGGILASGYVVPIATSTGAVGAELAVGDSPSQIVISPNGSVAYVVNSSSDNAVTGVTPIKLKTATVEAQIPRPGCPSGTGSYLGPVGITPSGSTLELMCTLTSQVVPIATAHGTAGTLSGSPSSYGTPAGMAITPDQAPTASFTVTPGRAGSATTFNASSSTSPVGTITTYDWTFGDGTTATTANPVVTHVYGAAGDYPVSVIVTNSQGTSNKTVFTGDDVLRNGGPSAKVSRHVKIKA